MSLLRIREMNVDDAPALAHIIVTATRQTFTGLVPAAFVTWLSPEEQAACSAAALASGLDPAEALVAAEEARNAANWRRGIPDRGPDDIWLAADVDGSTVGYATAAPSVDDPEFRGELGTLYVLPTYHGRGVGRALVQAVAQRLAGQGIHSLRVGALRVNPNRPFYARLGAEYLYDRPYEEAGHIEPECVYGWRDTRPLVALPIPHTLR